MFLYIGLAVSHVEYKQLESFADAALIALGQYTFHQQRHWFRFGKLLMALRTSVLLQADSLLGHLCRNVANDMLHEMP